MPMKLSAPPRHMTTAENSIYDRSVRACVRKENPMSVNVIEISTSEDFKIELCKILGIEAIKTAGITIRVVPNSPILVTIDTFAFVDEAKGLLDAFRSQIP